MLLTQNIDGLHQRAGTDNIIELHGSVWKLRCTNCLGEWENRKALKGIPQCDSCHSMARPAVVWFGESLNQFSWDAAMRSAYCDVFLVVGTSALVDPVASLPHIAKRNGARIIEVNKQETLLTKTADLVLEGLAGEILPQIAIDDVDISGTHEMDLGRAIQRGLIKFYEKYPHLMPNSEMLPENPSQTNE
jgi:NAD-dependent deacetylase